MAAVPKHDGKKKRKCDDGKQSCLSKESENKKKAKQQLNLFAKLNEKLLT